MPDKYRAGDILYYVNPMMFFIEAVQIQTVQGEDDWNPNLFYYTETKGAILEEGDLFESLSAAKTHAITRLDKFYFEMKRRIEMANPPLEMDEGSHEDYGSW